MQPLTMTCSYGLKSAIDLRRAVQSRDIEGWCRYSTLLTTQANPKTAKNSRVGDYTAILHLAPAVLSGRDVCPWRSPGCTAACLHTAGNTQYLKAKTTARIARTHLFFQDRPLFLALLRREIEAHVRRAVSLGMHPSVRLNGTSDIPWEKMDLMDQFYHGGLTFYDYTKSPDRAIAQPYHLTFSRSECNDHDCQRVLANGGTVAVVVEGYGISRHPRPLPSMSCMFGPAYSVIDGDTHDARYRDRSPAIVALRAKGDAIGDTSGFVVPRSTFQC